MRNPQLKRAFTTEEWTPQMVSELRRCREDPIYFMRNYVVIQHPTKGAIKFDMFDYQERFVRTMHENRSVITLQPRQCGKTLTAAMYLLWYALFHDNVTMLIASKNQTHAIEIAARVKFAYEELPSWLKCGLIFYNLHKVEFDNGSKVVCEATTEKTGRGGSFTKIYLDELAFISPRIQMKLWASLKPALSTGGSAIVSSTPNGDTDLFANLWRGANSSTNTFVPFEVHWREHPERGDAYWNEMVADLGELVTRQEVGCVLGNTTVTTRNKLTGVVQSVTIEDVAKELLTSVQDSLPNNLNSSERQDSKGFGWTLVRDSSYQQKPRGRSSREPRVYPRTDALRSALGTWQSVRSNDGCEASLEDAGRAECDSTWRETIGRNLQEDLGNQTSTVRSRIGTIVQGTEAQGGDVRELECNSAWQAALVKVLNGSDSRDSSDPLSSSRGSTGEAKHHIRVGVSETSSSYEVPRVLDERNLQDAHRKELVLLIQNKILEILTPSGFQNFKGIRVSRKSEVLKVRTTSAEVTCSVDHLFGDVSATKLIHGDRVPALKEQRVLDVHSIKTDALVYDPVEVQGGHKYITNGLVSHNCEFLSSDAMLINSMKLAQIAPSKVLYTDMGFKFWVPEEELGGHGKTYLVGVDPATGGGNDFTVIQVFDFPGLRQVAEWRSNEVNIPLMYAKLKWLLNKLSAPVNRGRAEVLWTFERNGVGEAMCALYLVDEKPPEYAELYCDVPGKYGVYTSGKTKVLACLQMKTLVEKIKGGFTINSEHLLFELKNFVAKAGTYEGKSGVTDDAVMATVNVVRLLKRLSDYNEEAFKKVNEYVDPDTDADDWRGEPVPFLVI